jgi:KaiC domain protein
MSDNDTEDDWFESAFEDGADEDRPDGSDGHDSGGVTDEAGETPAPDDGPGPGDADAGDAFGGAGASESPFGDTGIEGDAFGGGSDSFAGGGDEELFDEGFGDAMGSMGDDSSGFDDEELDSDIPRLDLGIEGLDNMIQGGVPRRHLVVIIGGAGTGKTTFGLQFLKHGLARDDPEKGVFITLEQTYEDIMATADERGWEFRRHEREGNLAIVDLDPVEMANSLDNIRGELPELIEDFGADRFVLDSVSLLEMMYDRQAQRRTEVFDFTQSLKDAGVTTVFTSEASEENPYASRHGIIEYLTDAVFLLRYVRSETQETRLAVEIQKIRNANHSRETKPYEITLDGISVYEQANIF